MAAVQSYPELAAVAADVGGDPSYDVGDAFEVGLDVVLGGFER